MNLHTVGSKLLPGVVCTALSAGLFSAQAAESDYKIGTWANFCKGAVSHTFDDNTGNQLSKGVPAFDEKNLPMTLFIITGQVRSWADYKAAAEKGHEIASHSVSHSGTMPDSESKPSKDAIEQNTGTKCITLAYPNCNLINSGSNYKTCYIAARNCSSGEPNATTPNDFYNLQSQIIDVGRIYGGITSTQELNDYADKAADKNGWGVYLHHGIDGDHSMSTSLNELKGNLDYLDKNRDKIWCGTFGQVAQYIKERDAASVSEKAADDNTFTIEITDNLDDDVFDYPLTIRRPLPQNWNAETVSATQDGDSIACKVVTDGSSKFIQINAVPDGGEVVISSGATPVRHGMRANLSRQSEILIYRNNTLRISTIPFTGNKLTVSLFNLNGKLLSQQTVITTDDAVTMEMGTTFNKSAFIARVTDGEMSHQQKFIP